jgi:hypothetical protein
LYLAEVGFAPAVKISIFVTSKHLVEVGSCTSIGFFFCYWWCVGFLRCHAEEQNTAQKDRHPATTKQKHAFQRVRMQTSFLGSIFSIN